MIDRDGTGQPGVLASDFKTPTGDCPAGAGPTQCVHRGVELRRELCKSCSGQRKVKVFVCGIHRECTIGKKLPGIECCGDGGRICPNIAQEIKPRWVSHQDLVRDSAELAAMLPPDVTAIAGVTRSGMLPATLIAMQLHLPLFEINPKSGLREMSHGWRLKQQSGKQRKIAVIDDTVASGTAMRLLREKVLDHWDRDHVVGTVYASREASHLVDHFAVSLPLPHFLEWNMCNSVHSRRMAFDMDGVICEECPADCDDDGPRYRRWMETVRPLYLPRKYPVKLLATARLEKYREPTMAWLDRHGVKVEDLVMGPWKSLADRRANYDAGEFKGAAYRDSGCDLFAESCPKQSAAIAAASGKRVICPTSGEIWG